MRYSLSRSGFSYLFLLCLTTSLTTAVTKAQECDTRNELHLYGVSEQFSATGDTLDEADGIANRQCWNTLWNWKEYLEMILSNEQDDCALQSKPEQKYLCIPTSGEIRLFCNQLDSGCDTSSDPPCLASYVLSGTVRMPKCEAFDLPQGY